MLSPSITQKFKFDTFTALGCKHWNKNGMSRIYINESELRLILGADANYYSSNSLRDCKYYYDLNTDGYGYKHYPGCTDLHDAIFKKIDEFIMTEHNAHMVAKKEREVTLDEINEALGL